MLRPILGQGKPEKKTAWLGALGSKIGEVHPQPLAGNRARRIFRKKMHSSDQKIICDDDVVSWPLGDDGCIVAQAEGARPGKRRKVGRNQFVFGRTRQRRSHEGCVSIGTSAIGGNRHPAYPSITGSNPRRTFRLSCYTGTTSNCAYMFNVGPSSQDLRTTSRCWPVN